MKTAYAYFPLWQHLPQTPLGFTLCAGVGSQIARHKFESNHHNFVYGITIPRPVRFIDNNFIRHAPPQFAKSVLHKLVYHHRTK